nr:hypothetical protein [Tanacetum cinerariifolium]
MLGKPPSSSKSKLYFVNPFLNSKVIPKVGESNVLLKPVTSNSTPSARESKVVKNDNVIAPRIFKIYHSKTSRVDNAMSNKPDKASVRTKPITSSEPHFICQENMNSNSNVISSIGVKSTAKTRRPQPRSNTKNDRTPSASKSSCIKNKDVKAKEHHRNLLLSKNKKHMSSECNNVKLAIQNDKYEVVCAMCKKCLITVNHDVTVLNYVNDMNSRDDNQSENISNVTNQKKHNQKFNKSKMLESKEILALSKPRKPRTYLRWSPTRRMFDFSAKLIESIDCECKSDSFKGDNACTSNPQEPISKRFLNSTFLACYLNMFMVRRLELFQAYDQESKASYQFRLEVFRNCSL